MFEVLKQFFSIHYNFAGLSALLLVLFIFLMTKKNVKVGLVVLALFLVLNVFLYKRTEGKVWTLTIDPPETTDSYSYKQPTVMKFSVLKDWTITDDKGETHHWCWVEDYWDRLSNTDIVAIIWGENSGKKLANTSEERTKLD